jgi:cell division transport system permease protein
MAGSLILFQVLLQSTLAEVEKKVDISVYFKLDALEDDIFHVEGLLGQLPEVESVEYISKEEALEIFKGRHADNALITGALDELGDNPLGASLRIRATDPSNYESISLFLQNGSFSAIDKINFQQNRLVFDRLTTVLSVSRRAGLSVSIVLGAIAFLVAFNTIRLAIYTSREEIGIMKLVGASNWFVRAPFLVEGILYGVSATIIVVLIFWPLTLWLGPQAKAFFGGVDLFSYYASNLAQFTLMLLLVGIVLGIFSSFVATRRYLKV